MLFFVNGKSQALGGMSISILAFWGDLNAQDLRCSVNLDFIIPFLCVVRLLMSKTSTCAIE